MTVIKHVAVALSLGYLACATAPASAQTTPAPGRESLVFFGTTTDKGSKGIYRSKFDPSTGRLSVPELAINATNPTFLALDVPVSSAASTNPVFLYAVNEVNPGTVSAYRVDRATGGLAALNTVSSHGSDPCHLSVVPGGRWVFVANYSSGSIAVLPVQADGSLGEATNVIQNAGSSVNENRQQGPHAHWTALDPGSQFLMACDLGIDKVIASRFDPATGFLATNLLVNTDIKPGSGPRHMAFRPDGKFAFVVNELNSTISVFNYEKGSGRLTPVQTVPTIPAGFTANNTTAEIAVHPDGRFLFASNRGHDSIVTYEINPQTGRLNFLAFSTTGGKTPRHFAIDPTGRWLLVGNQESHTVVVFRINQRTGDLDAVGDPVALQSPMCIQFLPQP